jgi:hypothetical protein
MKAKVTTYELRIGNFVKCRVSNDAGIYQVIALDGINLKTMLNGARRGQWYITEENIKPIPITDKWLLSFGFRQSEENRDDFYKDFGRKTFQVCIDDGQGEIFIGFAHDIGFPIEELCHIDIQYLHQLQNLIFSITGEELTIQ